MQGRTRVIVETAQRRWGKPANVPRLTYTGEIPIIDADTLRARAVVDLIFRRCPELTRADLMLMARMLAPAAPPPAIPVPTAPPARRRRRLTAPSS
jgi:hypothetical protein